MTTVRYRVVCDLDVVELLAALPEESGRAVVRLLRQLEANPFRPGSILLSDSQGRELSGDVAGEAEVHWWVNHADREVRLVGLLLHGT